MLWVKLGDQTYEVHGFNILEDKATGKWEVWITRITGKGVPIFEGTQAEAGEIYAMLTHAAAKRISHVEVK